MTTLWEQLRAYQQQLPQALLLSGSDVVQNQAMALAFAALLMCRHPESHACGKCSACLLLENHPDIYRVFPEKNSISIDDIRALADWVRQTPARGRLKVAVVSPVNVMTLAAMNGILKLLEEPPAGVLFLLVAPYANEVLPTIRSRCQVLQAEECVHATDFLTKTPTFLPAFLGLLQKKESPFVLAKTWNQLAAAPLLQAMQMVLFDLIKLQWQLAPSYLTEEHRVLAMSRSASAWYACIDRCQEALRDVMRGVNLNQELMLDALLVVL